MRIRCPRCHEKFDLSHRQVLTEAARLAKQRAVAPAPTQGAIDGNVLPANDLDAKRLRDEAIARRAKAEG